LYGLVGADVIEQVWKERQRARGGAPASHGAAAPGGNGENGVRSPGAGKLATTIG
jgi:hypothetical protein